MPPPNVQAATQVAQRAEPSNLKVTVGQPFNLKFTYRFPGPTPRARPDRTSCMLRHTPSVSKYKIF
jgi:hypothetical protein